MDLSLATIVLWAVPVVFAITLHEAAHGYVARRFGDQTAYMLGRVTLNPLKHIDPIGTIAVPGFLIAMSVLWSFYFALAFLYPGGMGFGDVKLAGLLGLYLGWLGWSSVLVGTFTGFLLGGLVGVALLATRKATRRSAIPFGPAMLAGALLAVFLAGPIADWYRALLTPTL